MNTRRKLTAISSTTHPARIGLVVGRARPSRTNRTRITIPAPATQVRQLGLNLSHNFK